MSTNHELHDDDQVWICARSNYSNFAQYVGHQTTAREAREEARRLIADGWVTVDVRPLDHPTLDDCHTWVYTAPHAFLGTTGGLERAALPGPLQGLAGPPQDGRAPGPDREAPACQVPGDGPVKVAMKVTVDVDPEVWAMTYGLETNAEIREDVKTYVHTALDQGIHDSLGVPVTVTVR